MKKILILIGLIACFNGFGQSWDAYYGLLPQSDISSRDSVQLLVIDAEKDSTYYMLVSQLDLIWSFDSTYLHYRVDSLSTVLVNLDPMVYPTAGIALSTGTGWGTSITDNSTNWNSAYSSMHDAVTLAGTPDYITITDQVITRGLIVLTTDVSGELDTANINMAQIDDKFIAASDSLPIVWGNLLTGTETATELTVNVDPIPASALSATGTADATTFYRGDNTWATVATELDSSTLTFKNEVEPLFFFNLGRGVAADTALFDEVGSMIDPVFNRSRDTLVVTNITGGARGKSGDTLQYQVMYAPKFGALDSTMIPLMEGSPMDLPVGTDGTANVDENVIVNDTIPPDNWVWAQLVGITANDSVTGFASTVSGYKVKGTFNESPFASYTTEYQAVLTAMTTDPTGDTLKWGEALLDSFVTEFGANLHVLYVPATTDNGDGEALINWANPGTYDLTNGIGEAAATWTALQGYKGDGVADTMTTNYNPATASMNLDDVTIGTWININQSVSNSDYLYAARSGMGDITYLKNRDLSDRYVAYLNTDLTQTFNGITQGDSLVINTRNGPGEVILYRNGEIDTDLDATTAVVDDHIKFFHYTYTDNYGSNEISIFFIINDGVTTPQMARMTNWVNTYIGNIR